MATNNPKTDSDFQNKLSNEEKKFYNEVQPQTGYDRSLFMVGIIGAGKSSFCNFLANEKLFEEGEGLASVTQGGSCCRFKFNQEEVLIIDSPGFCDSIREDSEIFDELCKLGVLAKDGTDAVAIVISLIERFSDNHRKAFIMMEQMGGSFWEHAFIVFTNEREALRRNKVKTQEEYCQKVLMDPKCPILKELLTKTENRYIFVDNIADFQNENSRNDKCNQIFELIQLIRNKNDNQRYNNSLMLQGRKFFEERQESDKKLKDLEEALKLKDMEMEMQSAQFKQEEEMRTQEVFDARKQEELRKEETERLKIEKESLKQENIKMEMQREQFKQEEQRRTQEAIDARKQEELKKEESDRLLERLKTEMKIEQFKQEEERRTQEALNARKQEELRKEESERTKREQERQQLQNDKNAEKMERLQKEMHDREIGDLKSRIKTLETEKRSDNEKINEMERDLRDSRVRKDLDDERRREEQVRELLVAEYKQNVEEKAEKQSWGGWLRSMSPI